MKWMSFLFVIIISCVNVPTEENPDVQTELTVKHAIDDLTFELGKTSHEIDLSDIFYFENKPDSTIRIEIDSVTNTSFLSAKLSTNILHINVLSSDTGSCKIVLKAEKDEHRVRESFTFSIIRNMSEQYISEGITAYKKKDYTESSRLFKAALQLNDSRYLDLIHTGMGFNYIKLNKLDSALMSFKNGVTYTKSTYLNDIKMGLSILYYSYSKKYDLSVKYGLEVLVSNANYMHSFDSALDAKDIKLTIALSQFSLKQFIPCYEMIKQLDSSYTTNTTATDFIYQLDLKLQALIKEINET